MKLYVGNLNYRTTEEGLRSAFEPYGTVKSVNLVTDRMTGRSRGFAFVEMASDEEGQAAIEGLNDKEFEGRTLKVNVARPREPRRDGGRRPRRPRENRNE